MKFIKEILRKLVPDHWIAGLKTYLILSQEFGQGTSIKSGQSVDKAGVPVPWYTYPAIEFLKQLDFSDSVVFEYGSGNSTLFWATRCNQLCSVENNPAWYDTIRQKLPANVNCWLETREDDYVNSISVPNVLFDVIIIDGSYRTACATLAVDYLLPTGFIILDNSDRELVASSVLRNAGLIEVDMSGFGPINAYTWSTSLYLSRAVVLKPANENQPLPGIGALL